MAEAKKQGGVPENVYERRARSRGFRAPWKFVLAGGRQQSGRVSLPAERDLTADVEVTALCARQFCPEGVVAHRDDYPEYVAAKGELADGARDALLVIRFQ